jgi:hypothetical protein
MGKIIQYEHHGKMVSVDEILKGTHRQHCLCFRCEKFIPTDIEENCRIANLLFLVDQACEITTPVFECEKFRGK